MNTNNGKTVLIAGLALGAGLALMGVVALADMRTNANAGVSIQTDIGNESPTVSNPPLMTIDIAASGDAHVSGTVSKVSGDTITITSWGGTWTIDGTNATAVSGKASSLSEIKVGDVIMAGGLV